MTAEDKRPAATARPSGRTEGLGLLLAAGLLVALSRSHFLLFHTLAELAGVAVAWSLFLLVWNTRRHVKNDGLRVLAEAYLLIGLVSLLHTLAYKGMGVWPQGGTNPAAQLWLLARLIEALAFLGLALIVAGRAPAVPLLPALALLSAAGLAAIWFGAFPACSVEGAGLTTFKQVGELVVCGLLASAGVMLWRARARLDAAALHHLLAALGLAIAAELSFTLYVDPYDLTNTLGHMLKLGGMYCVYKAMVETALTRPYALLWRDLAQQEAALRQSEARYQTLFAEMLNGYAFHEILCDDAGRPIDYRFLEVNPAFERLTGLSRKQVLGKTVREVMPDTEDRWIEVFGEVALTGRAQTLEHYAAALGKWFWVSAFQPCPRHFACVFSDVTERRQAEEALHRHGIHLQQIVERQSEEVQDTRTQLASSETQLQTMVEDTPILLIATDSKGLVTRSEGVDCLPHGLSSAAEMRGKSIFTLTAALPDLPEAWRKALRGEVVETRFQIESGQIFDSTLRPERNREGAVTGALMTATDVTAEVTATIRSAQRLDALEAVYAMATRLGRSIQSVCDEAAELLAQRLGVAQVSVLRQEAKGPFQLSLYAQGRTTRREVAALDCSLCRAVYTEGRRHQYSGPLAEEFPEATCARSAALQNYLGVPLLDTQGNALGVIAVMAEGEGTYAEEEIHLLEIFAQYIAYEIEHDRLARELSQAEQARFLGQIASGVAHEVRNPLSAINVTIEVLQEHIAPDAPQRKYVDRIRRQTERLAHLMDDLLALRRPKDPKQLRRLDLAGICQEAATLWRQANPEAAATLQEALPATGDSCPVHADPERLLQVLLNLLDNAGQHNREGGRLQLALAAADGWGHICVADEGPGIPQEKRAEVFDPFFTTRRGGSGLGLAIVKHIVELHGGTIAIRNNTPAPGCTVEVRLPLATPDAAETD